MKTSSKRCSELLSRGCNNGRILTIQSCAIAGLHECVENICQSFAYENTHILIPVTLIDFPIAIKYGGDVANRKFRSWRRTPFGAPLLKESDSNGITPNGTDSRVKERFHYIQLLADPLLILLEKRVGKRKALSIAVVIQNLHRTRG